MDALLTAFVAAALAEFGDKTQLLVAALSAHFRRPAPILLGVALAALANGLMAAAGGTLLSGVITPRAISLLVAVALLFAGITGLMRHPMPEPGRTWRAGAFLGAALSFFLLELGDKTQFIAGALAAQFDALWLTAAGATAGVIAANIPAVLLGRSLAGAVPMKVLRTGIALLFVAAGLVVAVRALRLV